MLQRRCEKCERKVYSLKQACRHSPCGVCDKFWLASYFSAIDLASLFDFVEMERAFCPCLFLVVRASERAN